MTLTKEPIAVICRNRSEFTYMISWCEDNGKGTPYLGSRESFPIMICVCRDDYSSWFEKMDRAIQYVEFYEFIADESMQPQVSK